MILDLVIINKVFSFLGLTYSARIEDLKLYLKKISLLNSRVWVPSKENFCEMIFSYVYIIFSFVTCITSINFGFISVWVIWPFYLLFFYVCMYLSTNVCIHVCMCVCMYVCIYIWIYACIYFVMKGKFTNEILLKKQKESNHETISVQHLEHKIWVNMQ